MFALVSEKIDRCSVDLPTPLDGILHILKTGRDDWLIIDAAIDSFRQLLVSTCCCAVLELWFGPRFDFTRRLGLLGADDLLDVLRVLFSFFQVELLQTLMELVNVGHWLIHDGFPVVATQFDGEVLLLRCMEKRTNFTLVAAQFVTANALVFVRVVKPFHRGVTLRALQASRTLVPRDSLREHFAVFGCVFENLGRAAEVPHMVRVDALLAIVAVLLGRTPRCLVHEHVEYEAVLIQIQVLEVVPQVLTLQQALGHEVVLDTFVLEVQVDLSDGIQVSKFET